MAYKKKEDVKEVKPVAPKKEIKRATKVCPYCKSESLKKVKDTEKGALYSCGCGNRCQL